MSIISEYIRRRIDMRVQKIRETYLLSNEETGERIQLNIYTSIGEFDVYRLKVNGKDSAILTEAEKLAVETLKQTNNERRNETTQE